MKEDLEMQHVFGAFVVLDQIVVLLGGRDLYLLFAYSLLEGLLELGLDVELLTFFLKESLHVLMVYQ